MGESEPAAALTSWAASSRGVATPLARVTVCPHMPSATSASKRVDDVVDVDEVARAPRVARDHDRLPSSARAAKAAMAPVAPSQVDLAGAEHRGQPHHGGARDVQVAGLLAQALGEA